MERSEFKERLQQYKKAREENPGLKYWEWKAQPAEKYIPKYDEGTNNVTPNDDVRTIGDVKLNLFSGIFSPLNLYVDEYATKKAKEIFGDLSISEIRKRMYNNMRPYGYNKPIRRLTTAVKNNEKENIQAGQDNERDDIFAEYLQIPHNERHESHGFAKVVDSQYLPTIGSTNTKYKTLSSFLSPHSEDVEQLITRAHYNRDGHMEFEYLPFGVNKTTTALRKYFGEHTIGRLVDPNRGEYISVYDLWDIAPIFDGLDQTQGIGKPVPFYDRIYLDDYYDVNSAPNKGDYYGGYLPELEVKPKKYKDGGEVVDNDFMKQFGKQVSYKPEETSWWSDVKNWWNDLTGMKNYAYGNCATTPGGKHTKECAHYSNSILRKQGYKNITGDAWNRAANSRMKKLTSGYDGLTKPKKYNESDAHEYLSTAADNFRNKVDTTALNPYDVIGLYYPDSPNTEKAFNGGAWGETQTHTGHIAVGKDGTHYVVHNVSGNLKMNKLADMLTGDYDYLPVSAYRPRK